MIPVNILLVNLHSSHNAGDNVLLRVTLAELRRCFPDCSVVLSMNHPTSYCGTEYTVGSFTSWLKQTVGASNRWRLGGLLLTPYWLLVCLLAALSYRSCGRPVYLPLPSAKHELLQAYFRSDIIITNAGNYVYSSGVIGLPLWLTFASIAYGWLIGKPLYSMPQTLGPLRRNREQRMLRWLVAKIQVLLVRDAYSVRTLRSAGVEHPRCIVVPDLAFLFEDNNTNAALALLQRIGASTIPGRPRLGVTVVNWGAQDITFHHQARYERAVAQAIRTFVTATGGRAILFPQVCGPLQSDDDRIPAQRVAAQLSDLSVNVMVINEMQTPDTLAAAYGQMDIFLGTRMHSNIFALTRGVPVVAIAYQEKTFGTMEMLHLGAWVIALKDCQDDAVAALLMQVWDRRESLRTQILQEVAKAQAHARTAIDHIRTNYVQIRAS